MRVLQEDSSLPARRACKSLRLITFLFCLLLLTAGPLAAASLGAAAPEDLSISFWGTRSGLPETAVQALALEPSGGLWVGTAGGPCLFDGTLCRPLQNPELSSFPVSNLTTLLRARDASLWAGTEGGGLLHISKQHVTVFDARRGLTDGYVRALFQDSRGKLWVGTEDGLYQLTGTRFERVPVKDSRGPQDVHAIVEDADHQLIVGGETLRRVSDDGTLVSLSTEPSAPHRVRSLVLTSDNHLLIGTVSGAFEEDADRFRKLPLPAADVQALYSAQDGTLWAGTVADGLWRIVHGRASRVSLGSAQFARSIESIVADQSDRLWVGTETGLIRLEHTDVRLVPSSAASVDRETLSLTRDGNVVLVNNHVYRIQNDRLIPLPLGIPASVPILNVLYSRDGAVWAGTAGKGVYRVDAQKHVTWFSTTSRYKITGDFARGLMEDEEGSVWVATGFGLSKISQHAIEQFTQSNGLPNRQVRSLFLGDNGCVWIGTDGGPAEYCHGQFVHNQATADLAGEEIWAITEDRKGDIWFGTHSHGLYGVHGSSLRHIGIAQGLLSNFIFGLTVADDGVLWMSSPEIISSVTLDAQTTDPSSRDPVFASYQPLPRGAEELRFSGGRFPNALVDAHNVVWFASNRGAVEVSKASGLLRRDRDTPVPIIDSLLANDSYAKLGRFPVLSAYTTRLTFAVRTLYLGSDADVLLAYRLAGVMDHWTVVGADHQIQFQTLRAGKYKLELRAYSRSNPRLWRATHLDFVIQRVWYRSWWFYGAIAAVLVLFWWTFHVLHVRSLRREFRLVLEERARLAREMHDTLIQGCNGVAMLLEAEASTRTDAADDFLDRARDQLRITVADAREAVWQLRQTDKDPDMLRRALDGIASEASHAYGIPVKVEHSRKLPKLSASTVHELLMILREAVVNAGMHGHPRFINLSAEQRGDRLFFNVADDGVGFNVTAVQTSPGDHYGLIGMRERAEALGAELQVTSEAGRGTTVNLSMHVIDR